MKVYKQTTTEQRDHYVRSVLEGVREMTNQEIQVRQVQLHLTWLTGPFAVAMVAPDYCSVSFADKDQLIHDYKEEVHHLIREKGISVYCITNAMNNVECLMSLPTEISQSNLDGLFVDIHEKLMQKFGLDLFVGVGTVVEKADHIHFSRGESLEMLGYKFQYATRGVISAANVRKYQYVSASRQSISFERVIGCFMDGDIGKLSFRLDELIEEVRIRQNTGPTSIKRTLAELVIHILHIASNEDKNIDALLNGRDPYNWIIEQTNTPVIREWIMEICTHLIMQRRIRGETTGSEIILRAQEYIKENLSRADLTLQQISDEVGLTAPYFSQLFSKETGEGVSNYMTRLRMEQAEYLLRESELKVDMIAGQLGYTSGKYFIQVFKKYHGTTPAAFRKLNT